MPSNIVLINGTIEYIVPDSKMEHLIDWLKENSSGASNSSPEVKA